MKISAVFVMLLVSTLVMGGMTSSYAEVNPTVLLKVATNAEQQVSNQLSKMDEVPQDVRDLYEQSQEELDKLEDAAKSDDLESAKEHFLSSMRIFKKIAQMITVQTSSESQTSEIKSADSSQKDALNSNLQRMKNYVDNLKEISAKHEADISFEKVDKLFEQAYQHLQEGELEDAREEMAKIKQNLLEINQSLRKEASKQNSDRAKEYAEQYLHQLDRLISILEKRGSSEGVIEQLKSARDKLASTSDPKEIIQEVRNIISIKKQFDLTKIDRLESRIMQVERTLHHMVVSAHTENKTDIDPSVVEDLRDSISDAKDLLSDGKIEEANELLKSIADRLRQLS